jgi:hypothetical protein
MRKETFLSLIICLTSIGSHVLASDLGDVPVFEVKPPVKPAASIWIEGEQVKRQNGWEIRQVNDCYEARS